MEEEINVIELLRIFIRRIKLIIISTSCVVLSTIFYTYIVDPIFTASVLFIPYSESKSSGGLLSNSAISSLVGIGENQDTQVEVALSTLESRTFLNEFAEEEALLPILFEDKWNKKQMNWLDEEPTQWEITDKLSQIIYVADQKLTDIYVLSVNWKDPELASSLANKLIDKINLISRERAIDTYQKNLDYLYEELNKSSIKSVKDALSENISVITNKQMDAVTRPDYVFRIIERAAPPDLRTFPKRTYLTIISLICGFLLSLILAYIIERFKNFSFREINLD